jgi:hypothetical protein
MVEVHEWVVPSLFVGFGDLLGWVMVYVNSIVLFKSVAMLYMLYFCLTSAGLMLNLSR